MFYGLDNAEEARLYLDHPVLGGRIKEISGCLLEYKGASIYKIMGGIDAKKLKSSMTLFDLVEPDDVFSEMLAVFYGGERDGLTVRLLEDLTK